MWRRKAQQVITGSEVHGNVTQTQVVVQGGNSAAAGSSLDRAARRLTEILLARANEEKGRRRLQHPDPIAFHWLRTQRSVQVPLDVLGVQDPLLDGDGRSAADWFRALPRRQLVILGAPGAGKSVAALLLSHALLHDRRDDEPVPVLLPISNWRPSFPMHRWIVNQILDIAPILKDRKTFGRAAARRLLDSGRIMPVLDGLDELPEYLHAEAIDAIEMITPDGTSLVVTSRSDEYESVAKRFGRFLTRAAAVEIQHVTPQRAADFLRRASASTDRRWDTVLKELEDNSESPVTEAFSSPLMIELARMVYRVGKTNPHDLTDADLFPDARAIQGHLLRNYVPSIYGESSGKRAMRWFRHMAQVMYRTQLRCFTWWQVHSNVIDALVSLLYGCVWGTLGWIVIGARSGVTLGCLAAWVSFVSNFRARKKLLTFYIGYDAAQSLRASLLRNAVSSLLLSGLIGLSAGAGLYAWLSTSVEVPERGAIRWGSLFGVCFFLSALAGSPWGSYLLSRLFLVATGRAPLFVNRFLRDAHKRGVIRRTGTVYEFCHVLLSEELGKVCEGRSRRLTTKFLRDAHKRVNAMRQAGTNYELLYKLLSKTLEKVSGDHRSRWLARVRHRPPTRWRRSMLVLAPAGIQAAIGTAGIVLAVALTSLTSGSPVDYQSGAKPREYWVQFCIPQNPCSGHSVIEWKLEPGSSLETDLVSKLKAGRGISALDGGWKISGCSGTKTGILISAGGIDIGKEKTYRPTREDFATESLPVSIQNLQQGSLPILVKLRRVDRLRCTVTVTVAWSASGVRQDALGRAKRKFRHFP
ncbi:NACHT domain-containing protein [Streptomyces sp.]|uniref:NACHT domain-containing protein n=1 Tax=Streptomyces sp. TaxID=1931 RepID=UPI0039C9CE26